VSVFVCSSHSICPLTPSAMEPYPYPPPPPPAALVANDDDEEEDDYDQSYFAIQDLMKIRSSSAQYWLQSSGAGSSSTANAVGSGYHNSNPSGTSGSGREILGGSLCELCFFFIFLF
jgi:hypothetical protein